jgi:hypothetical protein
MHTGVARLQTTARANKASVKLIPVLLALMTVVAGAIVLLAFQPWVDFGFTETSGTDAEAATGVSDGWFVAVLGTAIVLLIGGVIFRPPLAPVLLPLIAIAAVCILAIAGFDIVTNWQASGFDPDNPGILVQAPGDPTVVPYAVAALSLVIAFSAAVVRGLQLGEKPRPVASPGD